MHSGIWSDGAVRSSSCPPRERFHCAAELREGCLPAPLELGGDEPVVGIDSVELPLGEAGLVSETVDLLRFGPLQGLVGLTLRLSRASPSVDLGGGYRCHEGGRNTPVDRG